MPTANNPLIGEAVDDAARVVRALPIPVGYSLHYRFPLWEHGGQRVPSLSHSGTPWRTWVIMAGRGYGKTRAGAEWVLGVVRGDRIPPLREDAGEGDRREAVVEGCARTDQRALSAVRPPLHRPSDGPPPLTASGEDLQIALIGASIAEARQVMVEGPSGLLACARPGEIVGWSRTDGVVRFANGAKAFLYSGAHPEKLRGPEHDFAWCDELAKWRHPALAWNNLQLGLRRGDFPRAIVTTTPRRCAVLDAILTDPDTAQTGGSTRDNKHLPDSYVAAVERQYAGTRFGAQELDGVMPRDVEGSLWPGELVEACRVPPRYGEGDREAVEGVRNAREPHVANPLRQPSAATSPFWGGDRIVIGVDPPASVGGTCGIVVCGRTGRGDDARAYVLADASVSGASPEGWARAVADAARDWAADRIVAERNMGGDMVAAVMRGADARLPVKMVTATRGKAKRAEPVAALFERGEAYFAGHFPELEAELGGFQVLGGYEGPGTSPDRADAMVWAMTELMLGPQPAPPRIRSF